MGILNPVLWIYLFVLTSIVSTAALVLSIPVGAGVFFYQQHRTGRPKALHSAVLAALLAFVLLFLAGCLITFLSIAGPLAL